MELLIIALLIVVGFFFFSKRNNALPEYDSEETLPYFKNSNLLTPAELSFYHTLKIAVSEQYDINTKVRLADLISVDKGMSKPEWGKAFNRIKSKHIDFVLCNKQTSEIHCAIELDDQSHSHPSRQKRDDFVEKALSKAKLPLLRFDVAHSYQSHDIAQQVKFKINPDSSITDSESGASSMDVQIVHTSAPLKINESVIKECPKCGSNLVLRESKRGVNAGNTFWGCSNFPKCRYVEVS